jgi:hypothetical protein
MNNHVVQKDMGKLITLLLLVPVLVLLCIAGCHKQKTSVDKTQAAFERMAREMPYLAIESVIYDRPNHGFVVADEKDRERHFEILQEATDVTYPKEDLLKLLSHADPKVRTLAAVALFDREDPTVLPDLVKLTDDEASTFDGHPRLSAEWLRGTGIGPPPQKQTVGKIATAMVNLYLSAAGYYYGVKYEGEPGFAEYWAAHKDRTYCVSWFAVQLARASQCTSPTPEECIDRIRAVRKRIDALPADERAWVLLRLSGKAGGDALVTESELIEMCKALGPDKLMLMLQGRIPSDDPDLQSSPGIEGTNGMARFVLNHAEQLLRPVDAEAVLACERSDTELWAVAAAWLHPEKASQILHAAFTRFQHKYQDHERMRLSVALLQIVGETESKFVVDWIYGEQPVPHASNYRVSFIKVMQNDTNGKDIIARIIQDPRFDTIDLATLQTLVHTVNNWLDKSFASEDELRKLDDLYPLEAEYEQKYPEQAAKIRQQMSDWLQRLRAAVPQLQANN